MSDARVGLLLLVLTFCQAVQIRELTTTRKPCCVTGENEIPDSKIAKLVQVGIIRCVVACLSRNGCQSVNYKTKSRECQLNNRIVVSSPQLLTTDPDCLFFNITSTEADACPSGFHCDSVNASHQNSKVTGCLQCPAVENGHFDDVPRESPIGSILPLVCDPGYMARGKVFCQDNGTWSSPVCASVSSCSMVKQIQPISGDGEYWLRLTNFNYTTRIYCHNMSTSSPEEFLTLPHVNYGVYPPVMSVGCRYNATLKRGCAGQGGEIWFHKIKVNISTMESDKRDRTFTNISRKDHFLFYGVAYDCYIFHSNKQRGCGTVGRFTIDLRETGWKVNENQRWKTFGWRPFMEKIAREMNGQVLKLRCGGYGGGCKPVEEKGVHLSPCP